MGIEESVLCFRKENLPDGWLGKFVAISISESEIKTEFERRPFEFRLRKDVEADTRFKQIIPYVIASNSDCKILAYQRHGTETRLHNLWSVGIGGHINTSDCYQHTPSAFCALLRGVKRECEEELGVPCEDFRLVGIINEEITMVGEVHLGIVFVLNLESPLPQTSSELGKIRFVRKEELNSLKLELWSELALKLV